MKKQEENIIDVDYDNGANYSFHFMLSNIIKSQVHKLMMRIMVTEEDNSEDLDVLLEFPASLNINSGKIATMRLDIDVLKSKLYLEIYSKKMLNLLKDVSNIVFEDDGTDKITVEKIPIVSLKEGKGAGCIIRIYNNLKPDKDFEIHLKNF